jgi:glycosyltransferase involved in cell wall biosynthesis
MAVGVPVVATRVGGNPELVLDGTTGTLVRVGSEQDILQALLTYRDQPDRRVEHGRAGRRRVEREFRVETMIAGYEKVWRRVGGRPVAGDGRRSSDAVLPSERRAR